MVDDPIPNQSLPPPPPPPEESPLFHEVLCKASGKARRFSVGTESGFAVSLINKKLRDENPALPSASATASYIEAVNDDEEPISFGPSSILVNYGPAWKLQTVIDPLEPGFTGTRFRDSKRRIDPPADVKNYANIYRARRIQTRCYNATRQSRVSV